MDSSVSQVQKGKVSYALNAMVENFDSNSTSYQNETGNTLCFEFPTGYKYIGGHFIPEQNKHIYFIVNPETGDSQIGYMDNNDCIYHTYISDRCLNFNIHYPILKSVHKITNCSTEIFWTDGLNPRRYLDLQNIPYKTEIGDTICENRTILEIDCNKLKIQPVFSIPKLEVVDILNGGSLTAGTVQFAIQYCDVAGDAYTSYYSITNPTPIFNQQITTLDFNYNVGKSVVLDINNIDTTGYFKYFNVAVIKTVNNIASAELIATYFIDSPTKQVIYSGQNQTQIRLSMNDIFERFPYYEIAQDVTAVQDVLVWSNLTSIDRINLQQIANKIQLEWESYRIPPTESYSNELNATNLRSYLRDEIYPYEFVPLLNNGKQLDGFHIPGRKVKSSDLTTIPSTNEDFIGEPNPAIGGLPKWKIYNTASVLGNSDGYSTNNNYKGPYQYGEFAYWESQETYPCNENVWGELAGQPIRHHKFPDVLISPIFESSEYTSGVEVNPIIENKAIYPIGVRIDVDRIQNLIQTSNLTDEQKADIIGFKIVRGDRSTNKSVVAKGILRNVGKYTRENTDYYFPNYPYNDLREDPFLLERSNAYNSECNTYRFTPTSNGGYQYTDCFTNTSVTADMYLDVEVTICSLTVPVATSGDAITPIIISYDTYTISVNSGSLPFYYTDIDGNPASITVHAGNPRTINVQGSTTIVTIPFANPSSYDISLINNSRNDFCYPNNLTAFTTEESKYRTVFNSPETSFGQPYLGTILKLENAIFGGGKAHFVQVKNNALYKLLTKEAQEDALESSAAIADITGTFNQTAMFTAYQAYLQIYVNGITRRNYGWSYNSIASYNYSGEIQNNLGIKQRELDISTYLIPGVQSVNDDLNVNNFNRESSVYLKTDESKTALPYPNLTNSLLITPTTSIIEDKSRYINSQQICSSPEQEFDISTVCYYGSIKNLFLNQWGQIYSYETIDTGFQVMFDEGVNKAIVFGGDTFIGKFAFKTKLPFFIDNRVGAPDDSDIFYDEIGNVAYPQYWHSARSILYDYDADGTMLSNIISIKAHNFDCPNNQLPAPVPSDTPPIVNPNRTYYDGKMYMFAYGIPSFYCESSINIDLRQAFNNREGDFYPHVSTGIPDNWLQETFVPIVQDNTYYYNVSYSKQNKETYFSHLPINWEEELCFTNYPFREIHSDQQQSFTDNRINSWLIYRPISFFDFPQNYGKLTSLDGIENKQILARFENKSLLYNALYTTQTNTNGQVYLGQNLFSKSTPPLDFAETDLGYVGSQHKFLLKIPQGQISVDAKRGQIFLLSGNRAQDISAFGSGVNRFLADHLEFEILSHFPDVDIDNHFNGIGLHGVYDSKFDRVIISKLDYIPLSEEVKYDSVNKIFYINISPTDIIIKKEVYLTDNAYFCNKSWTLSFNLNTNSWVSFHSYIPNFYIAENNFFYSGLNTGCDLEVIAAEIVDTTTTTSTSSTSTSTTSTTCTSSTSTTSTSSTTTTSTSSTSTSTTTSTTTAAPSFYSHSRGNTPTALKCSSCPGSIGVGLLYTNPGATIPVNGVVFYSNSALSATFNGGNQWWRIVWNGPSPSTTDVVKINATGVITDFGVCSVDCP